MTTSGLLGLGLINSGNNPLLALARPPEITNVYYHHKVVTLDGYTFRGCRFDNCTLVVHSPNFKLDHCIVDEQCGIQYGPQLVKVIQLFTSRYSWWAETVPTLSPVKNADGTISIGG